MNIFLKLAFLFFIGSTLGWVAELFFRRFFSRANPERKWINPGFCVGPYLPLYGVGLCALYLLASLGDSTALSGSPSGRILLVVIMGIGMTVIEYISGLLALKWLKVRLWDYTGQWGNIQGIICPKFSLVWMLLGGCYFFFVHPHILDALVWLSENLAFSFIIGLFFGVFTIDAVYSANLIMKLKDFAEKNEVVIKVENLKQHIRLAQEKSMDQIHFFFSLRSKFSLAEHLATAYSAIEKYTKRR